ncbi:hypothetical protein HDU98_002208 [Podochytrium sp. JEL0797]|nr:hypothetical protein HDU98_002208 [Podochytrium sp. JEL0797]
MAAAKHRKILAAFDFDFTLVEDDSDHHVFEVLSPVLRRKMSELQGTVQWTDLMHQLLGELHAEGKTKEQIIECLGAIKFNPAILDMFEAIKAAGGDIIIVSDANTIYIDEILKAKNARQYISEIITNPGTWTSTGRLSVTRRIAPPQSHSCTFPCSLNLCKGSEIAPRLENYTLVMYGGDGKNDFCPMMRLREGDVALARRGHSLEKVLVGREGECKGRVVWWREVEELVREVEGILSV